MRRLATQLGAVVAAITIGAFGTVPPAQATTMGTATFAGVFAFAPGLPAPPAVVTAGWAFATGACVDAALHLAKPAKPPATAGVCAITATGVVIGNCATATGVGTGVYVDALGQAHAMAFAVIIVAGAWNWAGTMAKGPQTGPFTAFGPWVPPGVPCATVAAPGAMTYVV